jgi:hypothetical protein
MVMYLSESQEVSVMCRGINPIFVSTAYEPSRKLERYGELRFREGEDFKINIGGYVVIIEGPESVLETSKSSPPLLSPPITRTMFAEPEKKTQSPDVEDRSESPMPEQFGAQPSSPPESAEIQIYHDESVSPARSSLSPPPERLSVPPSSPLGLQSATTRNATNAAIVDALLTTLIFAEVKPTPLPRLIADLAHRLPKVEEYLIRTVLVTTPCIGIVHRSGKDAAGKELSDEYYYIPESMVF